MALEFDGALILGSWIEQEVLGISGLSIGRHQMVWSNIMDAMQYEKKWMFCTQYVDPKKMWLRNTIPGSVCVHVEKALCGALQCHLAQTALPRTLRLPGEVKLDVESTVPAWLPMVDSHYRRSSCPEGSGIFQNLLTDHCHS
uniref:Histidinol-phosphate aminotransferase 2 n=1 Tax=Lygus hesperus TaxID=30085 RepID=A0A0A9ZFJ9_LYGHE